MSLCELITVYLMPKKKLRLDKLIDDEDKYTMSSNNCHL